MATKQGFYSRVHLHDDLTISIFRFRFPFPLFPIACLLRVVYPLKNPSTACLTYTHTTFLVWVFKSIAQSLTYIFPRQYLDIAKTMGMWFAHVFDAQPIQRYIMLQLVILSDIKHLMVGLGLQITQCSC